MRTNRLSLVGAAILLIWTTTLQAKAPMGLPGSLLEQGQWYAGAEFAIGQADWEADGQSTETVVGVGSESYQRSLDVEDLDTCALFGQIAYGLTDEWDAFARVGAVQAQADVRVQGVTFNTGNAGRTRLDGDYGFAAGLGTRATLYRRDAWSVGTLLQGTWFEPGDSRFTYGYPGSSETLVTNTQLSYFQAQLSLAGICQRGQWYVWMGPFLEYTQGDLDLDARYYFDGAETGSLTCAAKLDDRIRVGAHVGGGVNVHGLTCQLEGQFLDQSWLVGLTGVIRVR